MDGVLLTNGSQGCVDPTSPRLGKDIGWSFLHKKFVSPFGYLSAFSNAGSWKFIDVKTTPHFSRFDPLWKLVERWARSLYQMLKLYVRPNPRNTFDGHPLRWARWSDKKEKKESSWEKLKAFLTIFGRPNKKAMSR